LALVQQVCGSKFAAYMKISEKAMEFYKNASPIIHYFVDNGADPDSQNGEALGNLCKWSNDYVLELIEYLLNKGADVNINASLPWWTAWNNHRPKVLQILMSHGGRANLARANSY